MKDKLRLQLMRPIEVKYRLKKVEKPLLEGISESLFGKRGKKGGEEEAKAPINIINYIPLMVGLLVFIGLFIFISSFASQINALFNMQPPPPYGSIDVKSAQYADYGNYADKRNSIANVINLSATPNTTSSLSIYVTERPLSKDIYMVLPKVVPSGRNESRLEEFVFKFVAKARKAGLNPVVLSGADLSRVAEGSTVMVPFGYPPQEIMSQFEANRAKRITFMYIGALPDVQVAADGSESQLMTFWRGLGISFQSQPEEEIKALSMRNALYALGGDATAIFDAVSIIQPRNSGWEMVFVPNTLENGWDNASSAAADALKVGSAFDEWAGFAPGAAVIANATQDRDYYFGSEKFRLGGHVFELIRYDISNSRNASFSAFEIRSAVKDYAGALYAQETGAPRLLAYSISGQGSRFELIAAGTSGLPSDPDMEMSVIAAGRTVEDKREIDQSNLNTPIYYQYLNSGLGAVPYVFEVSGRERYARTYIQFGGLDVRVIPKFNDAMFTFNFSSQGSPQEVTSATITCNSCNNRSYSFTGRRTQFAVSMADYFSGAVPVGKYNFTVEVGSYRTVLTVTRPDTTGLGRLFSTTNIIIGIVSLLIYFGGMLLARKDELAFGIDIPDFPSIEAIRIPLSRDAFIGIFEDINSFYKWRYTPVSIQDIKRQLSNIYYKGGRIYASDFNVEYIMDILKKQGYVKEELDFYGLTSWEKDSGFSVRQLAMFRSLRDMCIENIIPFSEIGRVKGYHTELKLMWNSLFIYFYEPKEIRYIKENFRKLVKGGLVFILFEDESSKKDFLDAISDGSRLSSTLKFYIDTGDLMLLTMGELENKLRQLKG
jgi:hypothetical protein